MEQSILGRSSPFFSGKPLLMEEAPTSATLLGRLRDRADQTAWVAFVDRYGRMIFSWCRNRGLQVADAEDVTQEVLTVLSDTLRGFVYDPDKGRFRNYLQVVTRRAVGQLVARKERRSALGGVNAQEFLEALEAREDLAKRLQQEFDHELLELAQQRVAQRVDARTLEAFRLTAEMGLTGEDAARQLDMTVAAVYMARSRVQKLLREEVEKLEQLG
jgi:RNA polymerase sigma factor (sigma-70 family)